MLPVCADAFGRQGFSVLTGALPASMRGCGVDPWWADMAFWSLRCWPSRRTGPVCLVLSAVGVCPKRARGSTGRPFLLISALGIFTTIGVEPRHDGVCSLRC